MSEQSVELLRDSLEEQRQAINSMKALIDERYADDAELGAWWMIIMTHWGVARDQASELKKSMQ